MLDLTSFIDNRAGGRGVEGEYERDVVCFVIGDEFGGGEGGEFG